ncbi:hypothetical protein M911_12120 [Ectothiorhodospira haloalkaliphila]|uniref:Uncharacterized protein n=1 Tax=Ectothiorhodospira haloalkaliphila TaxID=421628 RepID=W8LAA2_9GAMM|nr:hypothetical protein M911_01630 [Ectothiorhodospira haloalkaliphila]AHK80740.1 hypothetical protein M911_12120 [Ectothiorhodospira haloalkaliphila]
MPPQGPLADGIILYRIQPAHQLADVGAWLMLSTQIRPACLRHGVEWECPIGQIIQQDQEILPFLLRRSDLENHVIGESRIPVGIRDNSGYAIGPKPKLAARSLSHAGVAQIQGKISGA